MNTYTAFLRVRHPFIDPAEVTRTLGLSPVHAWTAGSAREADGSESGRGSHPDSYWLADLGETMWLRSQGSRPADPAAAGSSSWLLSRGLPLEAFLLGQVRMLNPHKAFFARLKTEGGTCELAVTLNASERWGIELPPALLRSLADLNIGVSIEVTAGPEPT
ncbi:MAG TPA: hypothetical protein VN790_00315 [Steroidobacteraceae bacterium]|nr:hypothetical protein [Steroidobacteraceae bacterium]